MATKAEAHSATVSPTAPISSARARGTRVERATVVTCIERNGSWIREIGGGCPTYWGHDISLQPRRDPHDPDRDPHLGRRRLFARSASGLAPDRASPANPRVPGDPGQPERGANPWRT